MRQQSGGRGERVALASHLKRQFARIYSIGVDSQGRIIYRGMTGFIINVMSPSQLTGINYISNDISSSIYPNPSENFISVSAGFNPGSSYKIVNITGSEVMNGNISADEKLNISSLSPGIYIIRVADNRSEYFGKFIKN